MSLRRFLTSHPYISYNVLALPVSYVALSSTPSLASVSLLLAVLILQTTTILNRNAYQLIPLILNLALGSTLANHSASTTALSSPAASFLISLVRGAAFSTIAMIPLGFRYTITRQASATFSHWIKIAAFPALWATSWMLITNGSPVGRFGSWTPLVGDEGYRWMRPLMGLAGVDFVAAGCAEVIASVAGLWIQGSEDEDFGEAHEQQTLIGHERNGREEYGAIPQVQTTRKPRSNSTLILAGILFLLSLPSYYISPLPLPIYSEETTPLSVACVLPPHRSPDSPKTPLDLYIMETRSVAPRAKIVLWPEGAVSFRTSTERKEAVKLLRNTTIGNKVWVGMSFEEPANNGLGGDDEGGHRAKLVRNGMVLISPNPKEEPVVFEYFKRNLVPIAESYSQVAGHENPPLSTIALPAPPGLPKPEKRSYPRPLSLTTSICLDFTQPFPSLPHHPDLILAPARTWHPSVGLAMASLASSRAEEIGASVLWCDGGSGAVNGVYGYGRGNKGLLIEEVGNGGRSWVATLGVPYNGGKDEERPKTVYGWAGNSATLVFLCAILGVGWVVEGAFERLIANGALESGGDHGFNLGLEHVRLGNLAHPFVTLVGYFRGPREQPAGERRTVPVGSLVD